MRSILRLGALLATGCAAIACGTSGRGPVGHLDASPGQADEGSSDAGNEEMVPRDGGSDPSDGGGKILWPDGAGDAPFAADGAPDDVRAHDGGEAASDDGGYDATPATDAGPTVTDAAYNDAPTDGAAPIPSDGGVCGALSAGPLPDGGDVTYSWAASAKSGCLSAPFCQVACDASLLAGLLSCTAVQGGYYWAQGSVYIRVSARQAGNCVYEIGVETEGAVTFSRCTTPLPAKPWHGLLYINAPASSAAPNVLNGLDNCNVVSTCNLVSGAPNQCDQTSAGPPTCPTNNVYGPC
ncbi:MAG: hypothetical protein M3O46_10645 [Myxococcota bacterium]|nr:hypothetical protein [Myxococcota bacterium]